MLIQPQERSYEQYNPLDHDDRCGNYGFLHVSGGEEIQERARLFRILRRQSDGSWKCARAIWHQLPVGEESDSSKE